MKDLVKQETIQDLVVKADIEHKPMLMFIEKNLPEITKKTQLFSKTASQFMDNFLTVSKHTPIRNARQCLAEIEKSVSALQEQYFKNRTKSVEIKILQRDMLEEEDDLRRELLEIEAEEKMSQMFQSKKYTNAAVRKINNYMIQYNTILEAHGKTEFNESDFEKEEEAYHISTAFHQAITSARSRGGAIDEGNHIYLAQIGINGNGAQEDVLRLLEAENKVLANGDTPSIQMVTKFLDNMIEKYKGCSEELQEVKKMKMFTEESMISLIEGKEVDENE